MISPPAGAQAAFGRLAAALAARKPARLVLKLGHTAGRLPASPGYRIIPAASDGAAVGARPRYLPERGLYLETWLPQPRLLVLGAGHIAHALVPLAVAAGFETTVTDSRRELATAGRFPEATEVVAAAFGATLRACRPDPYTFVLVVTSNHQDDLDCLARVLRWDIAFAALVASPERAARARASLLAAGLPPGRVAALSSPAGLAVGAVTPAEIAVAILAEMIAVERLGPAGLGRHSAGRLAAAHPSQPATASARRLAATGPAESTAPRPEGPPSARTARPLRAWPDGDYRLLRAISAGAHGGQPRALATVLATNGPASRGAGARMLITAEGNTVGSVGGGLVEAATMCAAAQLIADGGGWRVIQVDSTGARAGGSRVQACGGTSVLLVEAVGQ